MFARWNDWTFRYSLQWFVICYLLALVVYCLLFPKGWKRWWQDAFGWDLWFSKTAFINLAFLCLNALVVTKVLLWLGYRPGQFISQEISRTAMVESSFLPLSRSAPFGLGLGIIFLLYKDLFVYVHHRLLHSFRLTFNFHAAHHSARSLNTLSVLREHPVEMISRILFEDGIPIFTFYKACVWLLGFAPGVLPYSITLIYMFLYFPTAILRHSMLWVPFPRPLSYIFMSPAMHQIHHSLNVEHLGQNFGGMLSIWDWLFGTIHIPSLNEKEGIVMGIDQNLGLIDTNFWNLLLLPFWRVWESLMHQGKGFTKPKELIADRILGERR